MDNKFQIGDRVRIRDWDELIKEYGISLSGDTPDIHAVVSGMKKYCGEEAEIISATGSPNYQHYKISADNQLWYWNERFFELAEPECEITITTDELRAILNVR